VLAKKKVMSSILDKKDNILNATGLFVSSAAVVTDSQLDSFSPVFRFRVLFGFRD
jgi:hypothetical protein